MFNNMYIGNQANVQHFAKKLNSNTSTDNSNPIKEFTPKQLAKLNISAEDRGAFVPAELSDSEIRANLNSIIQMVV